MDCLFQILGIPENHVLLYEVIQILIPLYQNLNSKTTEVARRIFHTGIKFFTKKEISGYKESISKLIDTLLDTPVSSHSGPDDLYNMILACIRTSGELSILKEFKSRLCGLIEEKVLESLLSSIIDPNGTTSFTCVDVLVRIIENGGGLSKLVLASRKILLVCLRVLETKPASNVLKLILVFIRRENVSEIIHDKFTILLRVFQKKLKNGVLEVARELCEFIINHYSVSIDTNLRIWEWYDQNTEFVYDLLVKLMQNDKISSLQYCDLMCAMIPRIDQNDMFTLLKPLLKKQDVGATSLVLKLFDKLRTKPDLLLRVLLVYSNGNGKINVLSRWMPSKNDLDPLNYPLHKAMAEKLVVM
jgi:plasmid maintenance system antidote protein VapI